MGHRAFRLVLAGLVVGLSAVPRAEAAARVFVSVNGNDGSDCAIISTPCRTLNAGISQVDPAGEVIVIDTGSFAGANVTKSVKINVPTGVVAFSASPVTVNAGASDVVVLRGLTIKALTPGAGTGVEFNSGALLFIEASVIDGWATGIAVNGGGQVFVTDATVRNSSGDGIRATVGSGTARLSIDRSRFEGNGGCGVLISDNAKGTVRSGVASGNQDGFCSQSFLNAELNIHNSVASNNTGSGAIAGSPQGIVRLGSSIVTNNGLGLVVSGGPHFLSLGNNLVEGNGVDVSGTITVVPGQ